MLFTLKKLIAIFISPLTLGFLAFLLGLIFLFSKKYTRAKFFLSGSFLWFFLIGYAPFSNALIQPLEKQYEAYTKIDASLSYVLVLGHGHISDETRPAIAQLSSSALSRLNEGIRIVKQLNNAQLIVSGYAGEDGKVPHAYVSKKAAISLGIKEEMIHTLPEAKDTQEEAQWVKKIVGTHPFILVTSAFHMPRAMKIFQNNGVHPIAAPTDFLSKGKADFFHEPRAKEMRKTELAFHEYQGILWHSIVQRIGSLLN